MIEHRIGFGCGGLMRIPSARERNRLLNTAFDCGIRYFDVARMYGLGLTESEVGEFAKDKRDQVKIATKFGIEPNATVARWARYQQVARMVLRWIPRLKRTLRKPLATIYKPKEFSAKVAQKSLETSLAALQTDFVNLFLLHEPTMQDVISTDLLDWLEKSKAAGQIQDWGVAGHLDQSQQVCMAHQGLGPVLQFGNDIVNRNIRHIGNHSPDKIVTFSPFSQVIGAIGSHLKQHPDRRNELSRVLQMDLTERDALSKLLLSYCVRENLRGMTIFSTTDPARLKALVTSIATSEISSSQIDAFVTFVDQCSDT